MLYNQREEHGEETVKSSSFSYGGYVPTHVIWLALARLISPYRAIDHCLGVVWAVLGIRYIDVLPTYPP